ncbi:hypothetical protein CWI37_0107p0010 [Hamiltosporidium tvaerminnensis]|uniref:Uncharacterized protein n=1 Tax=Hamiltosporidium tvaerminnensis TaxID=1176355 RepID=A0A4Q9LA44_9MICR|nr:hypothetical protein CWI37_0107p0010 [Hamiltosporidium tvaerminnensis]
MEEDSRYTITKKYFSKKNYELDIKILTETKYPEYLVPIAYLNIKNNSILHSVPIENFLNNEGVRKRYSTFILIYLRIKPVFYKKESVTFILEYYKENEVDEFFKENIVDFTLNYLQLTNIYDFIFLWKKIDEKEKYLKILLGKYRVDYILEFLLRNICKKTDIKKFKRYFISRNIFEEKFKKNVIYVLSKTIKLLKTSDINYKIKIINENEFPEYFEKIICVNLEIFNFKEYGIRRSNTKLEYKDLENYELSKWDTLDIRDIISFFKKKCYNEEEWQVYFNRESVYKKGFDDFYVHFKLFKTYDLDFYFSKNDLKNVLQEFNFTIKEVLELAKKNSSVKNELKKITENLLNERCKEDLTEELSVMGKSNFIMLFNKYFKVKPIDFLNVYLSEIENEELDFSLFEKEILDEFNRNKDKMKCKELYFEYFTYFNEKYLKLIDKNFIFINPIILKRINYETLVSFYGNLGSIFDKLIENREHFKNYDEYPEIIAYFVEKDEDTLKVPSKKEKVDLKKENVSCKESYINDLLFELKPLEKMLSTFYLPKDLKTKLYFPRFWSVYLRKNRIESLDSLFRKKRGISSIIHLISVSTALFIQDSTSHDTIINYISSIKARSDDLSFYILLFLLYILKNVDISKNYKNRIMNLFEIYFDLSKTDECYFIIKLILDTCFIEEEYKIKFQFKILNLNENKNFKEFYEKNFNLTEFMFDNFESYTSTEKIDIYEAVRILDVNLQKYQENIVSGNLILNKLYLNCVEDPETFLKAFIFLKEIPSYDWSFLENLFTKSENNLQILSKFLSKITKRSNSTEYLTKLLLNYEEIFFKEKNLINFLSEEQKLKIAKETKKLDFFKNLTNFNPFPLLEDQDKFDESTSFEYKKYKENHFLILNEFIKLSMFDILENQNIFYYRDIFYCCFKEYNLTKNSQIFISKIRKIEFCISNIKFPFNKKKMLDFLNQPIEYKDLQNKVILNSLITEYEFTKKKFYKYIILVILGYDRVNGGYFVPLIIKKLDLENILSRCDFLVKYKFLF